MSKRLPRDPGVRTVQLARMRPAHSTGRKVASPSMFGIVVETRKRLLRYLGRTVGGEAKEHNFPAVTDIDVDEKEASPKRCNKYFLN